MLVKQQGRMILEMRGESRRKATGTRPGVSIITPSYNQGQFIEEIILSVRNQDYPNIEHIIAGKLFVPAEVFILKGCGKIH